MTKTIDEVRVGHDIAKAAAKKFTSQAAAAIVKMKNARSDFDRDAQKAQAQYSKEQAQHYAKIAANLYEKIDDLATEQYHKEHPYSEDFTAQ